MIDNGRFYKNLGFPNGIMSWVLQVVFGRGSVCFIFWLDAFIVINI